MQLALFTLPPTTAFLPAIAAAWLADPDPDGLILLPTRRAARALSLAFLAQARGAPLLLPRIAALGALDEAPLTLAGALDLPPPVPPERRLATLTRLILGTGGRLGAPATADLAWALAADLARLLDEAARARIDLAATLPAAVPGDLAEHWQITLEFLDIVTRHWPAILAEAGLSDVAAYGLTLIEATAARWAETPPAGRVWAVGSTGAIPAVADLLSVVARLPAGRVVLPGLDQTMPDALWDTIPDSHPQAGMARLLAAMAARRGDVAPFPTPPFPTPPLPPSPAAAAAAVPAARAATLSRALLPADGLHDWASGRADIPAGLERLSPADQQEEAVSIAIVLRQGLEQPGARVALITPDRALARRVAEELGRFGITADDSAGEPLLATPPAVFLRLLARVAADSPTHCPADSPDLSPAGALAPHALLCLLQHPLAAAGMAPGACRAEARALERRWRGPATHAGDDTDPFLAALRADLAPLRALADDTPPSRLLAALIESAEALCRTDTEAGPDRLWRGEDGQALGEALAALLPALEALPPQSPTILPGLLEATLAGISIRSRRALRGRDGTYHPRVEIWGLLEARLQTADLLVLGGLNEGVWPAAAEPGPWMSRQMRAGMGMPPPEAAIGQAAHDFLAAACAAPRVVLSVPRRRNGDAAVPSRWVTRLDALIGGPAEPGQPRPALPEHPACAWARALDRPAGRPVPATRPEPRPPVHLRPRRLSVTEIETWLRDPYAIHARHILGLRPLEDLEPDEDGASYGAIVHDALQNFTRRHPVHLPADADAQLRACMDRALQAAAPPAGTAAWWRPRLHRIADTILHWERERRPQWPGPIASELSGTWSIDAPAGPFELRGRADRIDRSPDGPLAIIDYKTSSPPKESEVESGIAPQLPLEAAMLKDGAFGEFAGAIGQLAYWQLSGSDRECGRQHPLFGNDPARIAQATAEAASRLAARVARFDDAATSYPSHPLPGHPPRRDTYARLARHDEWKRAEDPDPDAERPGSAEPP